MRKPMINHQIPMRKDEGKPMVNHQIPMRKDKKPMVNHQIPIRKDEKIYDKPSDSYKKR